MKTKFFTTVFGFIFSIAAFAQQENKTDSFKVYGNCGMCKSTIESSLKKKDGVISKSWDKNSKMIKVTYNSKKITVKQIGEKIAAAGYDNEYATASEDSYKKLHECCQYERPKKN